MPDTVKLKFPPISARLKVVDGQKHIWDALRQKWLVLTPEEWVRQHVINYMLTECGFLPQQIITEYPVNINGMAQRADIVAVDCNAQPYIVVECKEPGVKICNNTLCQIKIFFIIFRRVPENFIPRNFF